MLKGNKLIKSALDNKDGLKKNRSFPSKFIFDVCLCDVIYHCEHCTNHNNNDLNQVFLKSNKRTKLKLKIK